ncbi:MAG: hypothetical protein SFV52_14765 [Saprospiraceae bacterium]|nr:hypothetical protein [Saprospiraceae bacterium]
MFNQRLQQDPELSRENDAFLLLQKGIVVDGEKALRNKLSAIRTKLDEEQFFETITPKQKIHIMKNNSWGWLAAAAVLLIVVAVMVFMPQKSGISPEEAFARFYKPESTVLPKILDEMESAGFADAEPANDTLTRALKAYEANEYQDALTNLNLYLLNYPEDQLANLYLGLTLMQMNEYGKAIGKLGTLATDEQFAHKNTARWYLALSLTQAKSGEAMKQAKGWFDMLKADPDSGYSKEAAGMLELLGM